MKNVSIVDLNDFLKRITEGYTLFGHMAASLAIELPCLHPEIIEQKCRLLNNERHRLSILDDELIDILNLAGNDLTYNDHLNNYRRAFSSAVQSVNLVHSQLLTIRQSYQNDTHH